MHERDMHASRPSQGCGHWDQPHTHRDRASAQQLPPFSQAFCQRPEDCPVPNSHGWCMHSPLGDLSTSFTGFTLTPRQSIWPRVLGIVQPNPPPRALEHSSWEQSLGPLLPPQLAPTCKCHLLAWKTAHTTHHNHYQPK